MPHFMIVLIPYQFIKPFLDNKISIFEEYGAFKLKFYAYGKFRIQGRFAIYWNSRNNGPRCIGSTVYLMVEKTLSGAMIILKIQTL